MHDKGDDNARKDPGKPGFWQIILSTLAGAFGVQSRKNHQQDVGHGHIYVYRIAGLSFTVILVAMLIIVVSIVLNDNGR